MTSEQLDDQLGSIPGVASAEVTLSIEGPPVARVFLDGTRSETEVRERVEALLGSGLPEHAEPQPRLPKRKRGGLGRGLGEVIEAHDAETQPTHLVSSPVAPPLMIPAPELVRVAVVETGTGVHVEVEDSIGKRSTAVVDSSIDEAIVAAVFDIRSMDRAWDVAVSEAESPHGDVVVVTARSAGGVRVAGAACIEYGRPWALARALVAAIEG